MIQVMTWLFSAKPDGQEHILVKFASMYKYFLSFPKVNYPNELFL